MFDLSNVKQQMSFEVIPAGKYLVTITNAEMKDSKSGGQYIKVEFTIKSGPQENRKLYTQFNVVNANQQAVDIALSQLKTLLVYAKYANPEKLSNINDLCGLTVGVKTKVKSDEQYGDRAEVSYYLDAAKVMETIAPAKMDDIAF